MIEHVMIASVTKMAKGLCIGGYVLPSDWRPSDLTLGPVRSVRLIPAGELWHPMSNQWQPGQLITAEISERSNLVAPHTEDVTLHKWSTWSCRPLVHNATETCTCTLLEKPKLYPLVLREIALRNIVDGQVNELFSGKISRKQNGRAVVADHTLNHSTEWWRPHLYLVGTDGGYQPVRLVASPYQNASILEVLEEPYEGGAGSKWTFKYVGKNPICRKKVFDFSAGSRQLILRMSLARWWAAPTDQEKLCYADLSSAWAATEDWSEFVLLECDAPGEDGLCSCEVVPADEGYKWLWGLQEPVGPNDDLPF